MTFAFVLTFAAVAAVGGFQVCPGETLSTFRRVSSQRDEPRNAPQRLIKSQVVGPSPSPEPLSISKQVLSSFDGRDLRNDVVLGITEGVIFEACKVIVDLSAPMTGFHVAHALNSQQDEASYLVRGLLQEMMLNVVAPSLGVQNHRLKDSSSSSLPASSSSSSPPLDGTSGAALKQGVKVSLLVDPSSLASASPSPMLVNTPSPAPPPSPPFGLPFAAQSPDWDPHRIASAEEEARASSTPNSSSFLSFSFGLPLEFMLNATALSKQKRAFRRNRVVTVIVLRSFVLPLLLHSIGHSLPSFLSHEMLQEVEEFVEGESRGL